jgi:hypothetical protein
LAFTSERIIQVQAHEVRAFSASAGLDDRKFAVANRARHLGDLAGLEVHGAELGIVSVDGAEHHLALDVLSSDHERDPWVSIEPGWVGGDDEIVAIGAKKSCHHESATGKSFQAVREFFGFAISDI